MQLFLGQFTTGNSELLEGQCMHEYIMMTELGLEILFIPWLGPVIHVFNQGSANLYVFTKGVPKTRIWNPPKHSTTASNMMFDLIKTKQCNMALMLTSPKY